MDQYKLEKLLFIFFALVTCGTIITTICSAVAWNHWTEVLDKCPNSEWYRHRENCGCILFGIKYDSGFRGGTISNCYYVTFAPIPIGILLAILAGYHCVRVFINKKGKPNHNVSVERRFGEVVVTTTPTVQEDGGNRKIWLALCGITAVFAVYVLVYAIILTTGYYKTCDQYRIEISNDLKAFGNQQAVIYGRLSCSAIFDFMDYLFPNYDIYVRSQFINTSITLMLAIQSAWISFLLISVASIIYFKIAQLNKI